MENLPPEIVYYIASFVITRCDLSGQCLDVEYSLLGLNGAWRNAAQRLLLACAHISVSDGQANGNLQSSYQQSKSDNVISDEYDSDWEKRVSVKANISLIAQSGFQFRVKRLSIVDTACRLNIEIILGILRAFGIDIASCPAAMKIFQWMVIIKRHAIRVFDKLAPEYVSAARELGHMVAHWFPNISNLQIKTMCRHTSVHEFMYGLVDGCVCQLTCINLAMPSYSTIQLNSSTLTRIKLKIDCWNSTEMLSFNPQFVQCLCINNHMFNWTRAFQSSESNSIVFENLKRLVIYKPENVHDSPTFTNDAQSNNRAKLEFPKLTYLKIVNNHIEQEQAIELMQAPLETFDYTGCLSFAFRLCSHLSSRLEVLRISYKTCDIEPIVEEFVTKSNGIFSYAGGIPEVYFDLHYLPKYFEFTNVYWPNITHLSLHTGVNYRLLFAAIHTMPNLVQLLLTVNCRRGLDYYVKDANTFIANCLQPSSSILEMIYFKLGGWMVIDSCFRRLKWYFPNLKYFGQKD